MSTSRASHPSQPASIRVLRDGSELETGGKSICLALGFFDGVHLGHQAVLACAAACARETASLAVAVTFDPHPSSVLAPQRAPRMIYPVEKRLQVFADYGMDAALLQHFDLEFSRITPSEFVGGLARQFSRIASVAVGAGFLFGHKRSGNLEVLRMLGRSHGFEAQGVPAVEFHGDTVSSTRVREAIRRGRFDLAGDLLGRPYSLAARVVEGDKRGRRLGFPTANLGITGLVVPPSGVYAVKARVGANIYPAVANIGHRPTIENAGSAIHAEAHLLDFAGDLYGASIELVFLSKLREEIKFPNVDALRCQIEDDIASARRFV